MALLGINYQVVMFLFNSLAKSCTLFCKYSQTINRKGTFKKYVRSRFPSFDPPPPPPVRFCSLFNDAPPPSPPQRTHILNDP